MTKRVLMPMLMVGIILTMGSVAFAQSTVTCSLQNSATATVGPFAAVGGGTAIPATNVSAIGGVTLQGSSSHSANTGHTEVTSAGATRIPPSPGGGAIRVTCWNPGPTTTTANPGVVVLALTFGAPITNTTAHPAGGVIRVANFSGNFSAANVGLGVIGNSANSGPGTIVVGLGSGPVTTQTTAPTTGISYTTGTVSTFDIDGVLLGTNGKSGEIDAVLSETSGTINITNTVLPVITAVVAPLADPVVASTVPTFVQTTSGCGAGCTGGPAVLNANGTPVKPNFTLKIVENFPEMLQSSGQYNGGGVFPASLGSSTQINVVFKNVPSGLVISGCSAVLTDSTGAAVNPGTLGQPVANQNTVSAASNIVTINFSAAVDAANADTLWLVCGNVSVGSAVTPLPSVPVSAQVEMGPVGLALGTAGVPSTTGTAALNGLGVGMIPRFQDVLQPTAGVPVVTFPPSTSNMLVTFAFSGSGYATGMAFINSTVDPFTPANGGATPAEGTITFNMYKNDGTTKSYTTAAGSPGTGLSATGTLKGGGTYAVNLSDILTAAAFGTSFNGYIFVTTNFTNAHGAATIYTTADGSAALSTPVLVLPAISSAAVRATQEGLFQ